MNPLTFIKNIRTQFASSHRDINPFRDWFFITILCVVLIAVSLGVNVSFFFSIVKEQETFVPTGTQEQTDEETLNATEQAFIERTLERERFETDYRFVDPSL